MKNISSTPEIAEITQSIVNNYHPKKIYLFGSFARGEPDKNSDLDIFIVKNDKNKFYQRSYLVRKAIGDTYSTPIDVIVYTDNEVQNAIKNDNIFIKKIINQGNKVYDRQRDK